MADKSRIDVPYIGGILTTFIKRISNEFQNLLNDNEILNKFVDDVGCENINIHVRVATMSSWIIKELLNMPKLNRKAILNKASDFRNKETSSIFTLETIYDFKDGKVYVKGCDLIIRRAALANDIATHIVDLNYIWKMYKWMLRHEMGHFIDHVVNDHGESIEEYRRKREEISENYRKHYEWLDDYMKQPNHSINTINRTYYNIPSEARANEYGGIDVDEMIKLDDEYAKKHKGKITTIDIKTFKTRPEIKNGKRNDKNVQGDNEENKEK